MTHAYPGYQLLPNASLEDADVLILPVEHGASVTGRPGTTEAPAAILQASAQLEYYEPDRAWSPMKHLRVAVLPPFRAQASESDAVLHARLSERAEALYTKRAAASASRGARDPLLIALGGEHSITPSLTGPRLAKGTVVVFDAHADLRESYQGSIYSHACPVARLRAQGHRIVLLGVRSLFESEAAAVADDDEIELFSARSLVVSATDALACLRSLRGPVWLSFDLDAFDPSVVPSVGTPQPGGLGWYTALSLIEALIDNPGILLHGVDIVELVPEPSMVSQVAAAALMQKVISYWGFGRGASAWPERGSQTEVSYE